MSFFCQKLKVPSKRARNSNEFGLIWRAPRINGMTELDPYIAFCAMANGLIMQWLTIGLKNAALILVSLGKIEHFLHAV